MWPRRSYTPAHTLSEHAAIRAAHSSEESLRMTMMIARKDAAYFVKVIRGCNLPGLAESRVIALRGLREVRERCTIAAQALRLQRQACN